MKTKLMQNNVIRWSVAITLALALLAASFVNAFANASNVAASVMAATADEAVASEVPTIANTTQVVLNNNEGFEVKIDNNGKMHSINVTKGTVGEMFKNSPFSVSKIATSASILSSMYLFKVTFPFYFSFNSNIFSVRKHSNFCRNSNLYF